MGLKRTQPLQQKSTKPVTPFTAKEGMTIQTIQQKGNAGQKVAAPLFDYNNDGVLKGKEVTNFNNYRCKIGTDKKNGTYTLTLERWVNEGLHFYDGIEKQLDRTTIIKYKSLNQLYDNNSRKKFPDLNSGNYIDGYQPAQFDSFGNGSGVTLNSPYKSAEIDMTTKKVIVDGMEQQEYNIINIDAHNINLTVKNSDIGSLLMYNGKLKLENTAAHGFYDKPVDVATNGVNKVKVEKDANSKAKVFTWGEIAH